MGNGINHNLGPKDRTSKIIKILKFLILMMIKKGTEKLINSQNHTANK